MANLPPVPDTMATTVSILGGYGKPRRHVVTLPLVSALLEPGGRYRLPEDMPPEPISSPYRSRGPNIRQMVKRVRQEIETETAIASIRRVIG